MNRQPTKRKRLSGHEIEQLASDIMKSTGRKYSQEEKPSGPLPDFPKFERYTDVTIGDNVITCPVYYWKDNSVLPFPMPKPGTVKLRVKKQDITYLKIYSGFDIETSNVDIPKNDKGDVFFFLGFERFHR